MPSILPGYEYDIFISYRHNDNRSGWVTDFVKNLKEELAATVKEPLSVYFDSNPEDGLLESHDVDKSLAGKLKCLIFIPILSQTYCDPKSFAWREEFCAFNRSMSRDTIGNAIRLRNGNVAGRILPVKIHELDADDKSIIEKELGSPLRSIDFIFKSAGVNRPLIPTESHAGDNLNKTFYRDQMNKVANAVKDIVTTLRKSPQTVSPEAEKNNSNVTSRVRGLSRLMIPGIVVLACTLAAALYLLMDFGTPAIASPKSIAVIPFKLIGNDEEGKYFAEGVADALINHLHGIKGLKVRSRTSVEKYAASNQNIGEIADELDVQYILEGSAQKYKDDIRIIVQLINTETDEHIWFKEFNEKFDNIFRVQSEIALNITSELNVHLGGAQKKRVQRTPTSNPEAWDLYLRGRQYHRNFWKFGSEDDVRFAAGFYEKAIQKDSLFALAYVSLAEAKAPIMSEDSLKFYLNKAIEIDPQLPDAYEALGMIYLYYQQNAPLARLNVEKALSLDTAQNLMLSLGRVCRLENDHFKALEHYTAAMAMEKCPYYSYLLQEIGWSYLAIGEPELAEKFTDAALEEEPDNLGFMNQKAHIQTMNRNYAGVLNTINNSMRIRKDNLGLLAYAKVYLMQGDFKKSEKLFSEFFSLPGPISSGYRHELITYAYVLRKLGNEKKAKQMALEGKQIVEKYLVEPNYDLAKAYTFLGDNKTALEYLAKWKPAWGVQEWMEYDPLFEGIKDLPDFKLLVTRFKNDVDSKREDAYKNRPGKFPTLSMVR